MKFLTVLPWLIVALLAVVCIVLIIRQVQIKKNVNKLSDDINEFVNTGSQTEFSVYDNYFAGLQNGVADLQEIICFERNRLVQESKKNTKFISDISHQLKTPIAALNIYNGIIQGEAKELPNIQEFSRLSEQELDRIETLVQNLLKITKLDAGTIILEKSLENVSELAENVKQHFLFRAEQEGKTICLSGSKAITFSCDRNWILEAIGNLVKNALDHTEKGGLLCIKWQTFASVVQITVEDNGSGIYPEDLYHIFKRFYRSRFSKDTQGIGLGLPLTKAIVEAHNGTIEVDSTLGQGTTFTMNFLIPTKL